MLTRDHIRKELNKKNPNLMDEEIWECMYFIYNNTHIHDLFEAFKRENLKAPMYGTGYIECDFSKSTMDIEVLVDAIQNAYHFAFNTGFNKVRDVKKDMFNIYVDYNKLPPVPDLITNSKPLSKPKPLSEPLIYKQSPEPESILDEHQIPTVIYENFFGFRKARDVSKNNITSSSLIHALDYEMELLQRNRKDTHKRYRKLRRMKDALQFRVCVKREYKERWIKLLRR